MTVGWKNFSKAFNKRTWPQYDFCSLRTCMVNLGLVGEHESLIKSKRLGYVLTTKTFILDDGCWEDIIKANPKLRELRYIPLQC